MNKSIVPVINSRFPEFAKSYTKFREFMLAYFAWLEQEGNPIEYANTFLENTDSTNESARYWDNILADLGWNVELGKHIDKRVFVLFVRDYYLSRGTRKSLEFLFRLLYAEDVSVHYPRDDMLTLDNTRYESVQLMVVSDINDNNTFRKLNLAAAEFGLTGKGISSGAMMIVDSMVRSRGHMILTISTTDEFEPGESIRLDMSGLSVVVENIPHYRIVVSDRTTNESTTIFSDARVTKRAKGIVDSIEIIDTTGAGNIVKTEPANGFFATFDGTNLTIHSRGREFTSIPEVRCGNAIMRAKSTSIGMPLSITCYEPNIKPAETEFDTQPRAVFVQPAQWSRQNHMLDTDCILQDSYYYQQFSYRVDSSVSRPEYEHIVKQEVHPAGVVMFSRLNVGNASTLKGIKNVDVSVA